MKSDCPRPSNALQRTYLASGTPRGRVVNVRFHNGESLSRTFEYPSEEDHLRTYLQEHPEDEVLVLEEMAGWPSESSSDEPRVDIRHLLRAGGGLAGGGLPEASTAVEKGGGGGLLKSNTSLAHSGSLHTYRSKYQQEYEMGAVFNVPDSGSDTPAAADADATSSRGGTTDAGSDDMQILPAAEDDDLQTYSLDTSSDLLF